MEEEPDALLLLIPLRDFVKKLFLNNHPHFVIHPLTMPPLSNRLIFNVRSASFENDLMCLPGGMRGGAGSSSSTTVPSGEVETQVVECHPTPKSPLIRNVWALLLVHRIEPSGEPDPVSPSGEVVIPSSLQIVPSRPLACDPRMGRGWEYSCRIQLRSKADPTRS